MKIAVLAGGVGGAKFLLGVKAYLGWSPFGPPSPSADTSDTSDTSNPAAHRITAIVNTADDIRLHNLQICPDLDSCMYTLSGAADLHRGWGRAGETWTASAELAAYGAEAPWFSLGDKDIATHLVRTRMLDAGYPLSIVTQALCERWQPGVTLLPMTDERVETHVVVPDPEPSIAAVEEAAKAGGLPLTALHFQEWWIRYRAALPALSITPIGAADAKPGPGVVEAIREADLVLVAPSNPVVSIGTILSVPGIADALRSTPAPVVGVSPVIGGAPVRGHADACLAAIGVECSAQGIARHYGARRGVGGGVDSDGGGGDSDGGGGDSDGGGGDSDGGGGGDSDGGGGGGGVGILDAFLVAEEDTADVPGVIVLSRPLLMSDPDATAAMVAACAEVAGVRI